MSWRRTCSIFKVSGKRNKQVRKIALYQTVQYFHDKKKYPVNWLCQFLHLSRAAYYKWLNRKPTQNDILNEKLLEKIKSIHDQYNGLFGSYRTKILIENELGIKINHKRIERLMSINNIHSIYRKKRKHKYRKVKPECAEENILNRKFESDNINKI